MGLLVCSFSCLVHLKALSVLSQVQSLVQTVGARISLMYAHTVLVIWYMHIGLAYLTIERVVLHTYNTRGALILASAVRKEHVSAMLENPQQSQG